MKTARAHLIRLTLLAATTGILVAGCDSKDSEKAKPTAKKPPAAARSYDGGGADGGAAGGLGSDIDPAALLARVKPLLAPLPKDALNPDNPTSEAKVNLGRMLYFEPRLSKNHDISCNTCHDLNSYGVDIREADGKRMATSMGHKSQVGERNSPTVYNAALHFAQFWDGRAADVEEQAKGPILNPIEMAVADEAAAVAMLKSIPGYEKPFADAFAGESDPVTYDNMAKAIGAFERELLTPAPIDEFLGGKASALDATQLAGLELFLDVGCTQCHSGSLLGGVQFQKLGSVKPWPGIHDEGRKQVTKAETDKFMFKVPSLRNITETGPYLHNGSATDLGEVVTMMAEHQTARGKLKDEETAAIVAFLGALKGDLPKELIAKPELPEDGPKTPAADAS